MLLDARIFYGRTKEFWGQHGLPLGDQLYREQGLGESKRKSFPIMKKTVPENTEISVVV